MVKPVANQNKHCGIRKQLGLCQEKRPGHRCHNPASQRWRPPAAAADSKVGCGLEEKSQPCRSKGDERGRRDDLAGVRQRKRRSEKAPWRQVGSLMKFFHLFIFWTRGGGSLRGARGLPFFGTTKTSVFLTNARSRFAVVVLDGVLRPLRLAWHT